MSNPGKPDGGEPTECPTCESKIMDSRRMVSRAVFCRDSWHYSPQPSAEATLPTQTRISRACIAAANHLKELHVITYEANTVADIIYRHIRQALMEEYDGKL